MPKYSKSCLMNCFAQVGVPRNLEFRRRKMQFGVNGRSNGQSNGRQLLGLYTRRILYLHTISLNKVPIEEWKCRKNYQIGQLVSNHLSKIVSDPHAPAHAPHWLPWTILFLNLLTACNVFIFQFFSFVDWLPIFLMPIVMMIQLMLSEICEECIRRTDRFKRR